jgi:broad specificity phosphatase PhoE
LGNHEGLGFDEIIAEGEVEYIDFLQWIQALDGEPHKEYAKRVEEFFFKFLPSLEKENILVVTHAGVIRVLLSIINKIELEEAFAIKVENGSLTRVEIC